MHSTAFTVIARFLKASFMPLHFYERPALVPVFSNRKLKRIFAFRKKGKSKK